MIIQCRYSFKLIHLTSESIEFFWSLLLFNKARMEIFICLGSTITRLSYLSFDIPQSHGESSIFSIPGGSEAKSNFYHKTSKIKIRSTRVSKRYLYDKSRIHGREIASIFRFGAENSESDFKDAIFGIFDHCSEK